jgi:hypothetical protein
MTTGIASFRIFEAPSFGIKALGSRLETVAARLELLMDKGEELLGSSLKLCRRHPVYSRCPSVFLYLLPRCLQSSRVIDSL